MIRYVFIVCLCCGLSVFGSDLPTMSDQPEGLVDLAEPDSVPTNIPAASIAIIHADQINSGFPDRLTQRLQGQVPGLLIMHTSDHPGAFDTRLSIWGNSSPLLVIDGVIHQDFNDFQRILPADVEDVRVLKNNAATIYGSRGTNGVIEITTKTGSKGKPVFNYHTSFGAQSPTGIPRMANASEYVTMVNRAEMIHSGVPLYDSASVVAYMLGLPGYEETNWYEACFKRFAFRQAHHLSVHGGTEKLTYYSSVGFRENDGILKSNDLGDQKLSFRTNVKALITPNIQAVFAIDAGGELTYAPGNAFSEVFSKSLMADPTASVYANDNTDYFTAVSPYQGNPVASAEKDMSGYRETRYSDIYSSLSLQYTVPFLEGFSLNGLYSEGRYNVNIDALQRVYSLYAYDSIQSDFLETSQNSPIQVASDGKFEQRNFQAMAHYNNRFANAHSLFLTVGYNHDLSGAEWSSMKEIYIEESGEIVPVDTLVYDQLEFREYVRSVLGKFHYAYLNKYIFDFNARFDADSYLFPDHGWSSSLMAAGVWYISEEAFFGDLGNFISEAKISGSYGRTEGRARNIFSIDAIPEPGMVTSLTTEVGFELGFLENAVSIGLTGFVNTRKGLPYRRSVSTPNSVIISLPHENLNSELTRGIESWLGVRGRIGEFNYEVRANYNIVRTMNQVVTEGPFAHSFDKWKNGKSGRYDNILWGFVVDGQFQDREEIVLAPAQNGNPGNLPELPGDYRYKDMNGDGLINANDMQPLFYDGDPVQYYGLSLSCRWKGFDFLADFQGAANFTIRLREIYGEMFAYRGNLPATFYDAWTRGEEGDWKEGMWPANRYVTDVGAMYKESEIWRRNASFVRLKNIVFGYTLPINAANSRSPIEGFRIFVHGYNLLTFTDAIIKEMDPERKDIFAYPVMKSINLGVNISF